MAFAAANDRDVLIAVITAASVVAAAGFGFLGVIINRLRRSVGDPNGRGDIVDMLTRLLDGQAGQDRRLAALENGQSKQGQRLNDVEDRLTHIESQGAA